MNSRRKEQPRGLSLIADYDDDDDYYYYYYYYYYKICCYMNKISGTVLVKRLFYLSFNY